MAGVTVFLVLLAFAVQLALRLYATSVVTAAAYDAARLVATGADDAAGAEAHARSLLGDVGAAAVFEWDTGADAVRLRVVVEPPQLLPPADVIDRTVTVRREELRPGA